MSAVLGPSAEGVFLEDWILIRVGVVFCLWDVDIAKRPRSPRDLTHGLRLCGAMFESRTFQTCLVVRITWGAC